ncbi:FHF complex subunit HOOK-interacting protein 1B-like isoform X2 [Littorina saxatilis]|uniref:FHF complex subunit HOOK-interacting protein C-terminal domain-containing protein n=1 Tax=Littorina saxatilis TaxID=31220 RepID=A0AAN9B2I3_9CAEN
MSWFKRSSSVREDGRVAVNGQSSPGQGNGGSSRDRADTDPDTCFEVFKNHWQQALNVIGAGSKKTCSNDDVETVVHNFEQMMTLLVGEEGIDGMPGPILHFLLEKEVLETFCNWCSGQRDHQDKLCMEQLRVYELLISQSRQLLLIHRQVIRPLLRLLMACAEPRPPGSSSEELQFRLVLVLHQICTCISQETVILESFFSTEADHGPAKFLIFSLLIPYIHQEGPIGQRARDALLLLMTLSAVHPHIGHYIADNSDFCPVLATGLSGLYSSLPRKITPPSDDWYALTESDCQRIVDLQMFLNSLEFCNAVVQVAHPLVRDQLIKYIYTGFLVPVLGPALHQNSRDEVMTATAYLDLFLRRISEPHLIRAFLRFVLTERHDEILILESLITRISSNSMLNLVSLSLFHTLVDMNCEEVMFQLVFKYLIPCTHVMVSQRRAVRDLDLYGKSAEKFLSLRPVCCMSYPSPSPAPQGLGPAPTGTPSPVLTGRSQPLSRTDAGRSASISTPAELVKVPTRGQPRRRSFFRSKKENKTLETLPEFEQKPGSDTASVASMELTTSIPEEASSFSESCYTEYLLQARAVLEQCARACRNWSAPYDGEHPPPDAVLDHPVPSVAYGNIAVKVEGTASRESGKDTSKDAGSDTAVERQRSNSTVKLLSHGNVPDPGSVHPPDSLTLESQTNSDQRPSGASRLGGGDNAALAKGPSDSSSSSVIADRQCNKVPSSSSSALSQPPPPSIDHDKLHSCLHDLDSFLAFLNEMNLSAESSSVSLEESLNSLDNLLKSLTGKQGAGQDSSAKKSVDAALSSRAQDGMSSEKRTGPAQSSDISTATSTSATASTTTNPAPTSSSQVRTALPPKSLGLNPGKDVSLGGKCRILSPLNRTPDDMSRAFLMSPMSPGFLMSPSSYSAGLRPLPTALRYSNAAPNIGPFLAAVFGRLEGMVQNSLYSNLLLTSLVSRLAAYPHPLLRSFLLNVNLVFQPSVKSLVQVLSSVRQKVDNYAVTTRNFSVLIPKARLNLKMREDTLLFPSQAPPTADFFGGQFSKPRAATMSEMPSEKKKLSLADLFRRSPKQKPGGQRGRGQQLQKVQVGGGVGYRFINSRRQDTSDSPEEFLKEWNAVYCALLLEEFLKELAALSLEHSVLYYDEGYVSS